MKPVLINSNILTQAWTCSGEENVTAGKVIKNSPGLLHGLVVNTDGTNAVTVTVYDNAAAASGTIVAKITVLAADRTGGLVGIDVGCDNGIFVVISGTGGTAILYYE